MEIARFQSWAGDPALVARFFHTGEYAALVEILAGAAPSGAAQFLAGRFAAKEAFAKALGQGLRGLALSEICTLNTDGGAPEITLYGGAKALFKKTGAHKVHVSLSHDGGFAVAFVILES